MSHSANDAPWRVVVITTIVNGIVYTATKAVLDQLGHRVVGVLTTPGPASRRSDDYLSVVAAVDRNVDVLVSTHPSRWAAMLAPLKPDLIVCCGMPYRIPEDVVALPTHGAINVHPSLLPRHRGPWPINWAFRADDREVGITVHRIAPEFDTGPILAQASVPIGDDDDGMSVLGKLVPQAMRLLGVAFARVAQGDEGEPQDEAAATYAGEFEIDWRTIDWATPARDIHNQVRSWAGVTGGPYGAIGVIEGEAAVITKTRLLDATAPVAAPGTVVVRTPDRLTIQCADGSLEIVSWSSVEVSAED